MKALPIDATSRATKWLLSGLEAATRDDHMKSFNEFVLGNRVT